MSNAERLAALARTAKQREFERDFVATWEDHVTWDAAAMREPIQTPGEFVVEEEDILAYNRALGETDPLLVDPDYAREHAPGGTIVAHPLFGTAVAFWLSRPGTICSWIRTPSARNPFQHQPRPQPGAHGPGVGRMRAGVRNAGNGRPRNDEHVVRGIPGLAGVRCPGADHVGGEQIHQTRSDRVHGHCARRKCATLIRSVTVRTSQSSGSMPSTRPATPSASARSGSDFLAANRPASRRRSRGSPPSAARRRRRRTAGCPAPRTRVLPHKSRWCARHRPR